jgi:hypothetical protein
LLPYLRNLLIQIIPILKRVIFALLLLACCLGVRAQYTGDSLYFLLPTDTMTLYSEGKGDGHIYFDHYLAPGQTLFGAARFYGLTLEEVYMLNPGLRTGYESGDRVKVVIPREAIRPNRSLDSLAWFVPMRYRMGPGQTYFGLRKRILQLDDDRPLRQLNQGLNPLAMSRNQEVNIGYLMITGIPREFQGEVIDPFVIRNRGLRELWEQRTDGKRMIANNGKAAWTAKGDDNKWMALHRTAPINSLIEIDDPRSRKTLYARVVGRIPDQIYDRNVVVVVSPLLVKAFGVRDKHFYVRTRHF